MKLSVTVSSTLKPPGRMNSDEISGKVVVLKLPSFKEYYVPSLSLALNLVQSLRHDLGPGFLITMCPIDSDMYQFRNRRYSGFSTWDLDQVATTTGSDGSKMKSINFFIPQFYEGGHPPSVEASFTIR